MPKIKAGIFMSGHGCTIPHISESVGNICSVYVRLTDGRILDVPTNFAHYVDPAVHKEYARFMPDLPFMEWALQPSLDIIDHTSVAEGDAKPYGYISYVRKNGYLDVGLWDAGRRKGSSLHYPTYAGQLIMTHATDNVVMGKADVQKPEYSALCKEVAGRFGFQARLYGNVEKLFKKTVNLFNTEKMHDFGIAARAFLASGGNIIAMQEEDRRLQSLHPLPSGSVALHNFNLDSNTFPLSEYERLVVRAAIASGYFLEFNLNPLTLEVTFSPPSAIVLAQLEQYRAECQSLLGYQSPVFARTSALPLSTTSLDHGAEKAADSEYDSDDEFKGDNGCSIM